MVNLVVVVVVAAAALIRFRSAKLLIFISSSARMTAVNISTWCHAANICAGQVCDTPACTNITHANCGVAHEDMYRGCALCSVFLTCRACDERIGYYCDIDVCQCCFMRCCRVHKSTCAVCGILLCIACVQQSGRICALDCRGVPQDSVPFTPLESRLAAWYFEKAVALAELNLPVLVLLSVLDMCVPPRLLAAKSLQWRWDILRAVNRAWRIKNNCAV